MRLQRRPDERPQLSNFDVVEEPVPEPGPNEVLVRTRLLSVDPYIAGQIRGSWPVGAVMSAPVVSQVIKSNVAAYGSVNKKRGFSRRRLATCPRG